MLPVLYRFAFDTDASRWGLYLVALALVAYAAWSGWRNATGLDAAGNVIDPTPAERTSRGLVYGVIGAALALLGLWYALPEVPLLGRGRGEGLPIHTYGVLIGAGFVGAVTVASWLATREWPGPVGLKRREQILDLAFYVFLGGILGSRELFIAVNWQEYTQGGKAAEAYAMVLDMVVLAGLVLRIAFRERLLPTPEAREKAVQGAFGQFMMVAIGGRILFSFLPTGRGFASLQEMAGGGLVFYGGLIGATLFSVWYSLANGIEFLRLADLAIPTVSLGQALGRLGCFSAGCCWGDVTTHQRAPFAVEFPGGAVVKNLFGQLTGTPSLAYASQADRAHETRWVVEATGEVSSQVLAGGERIADWVSRHGHTLPVHPTQLYESLGQTVLFVTLLWARRYRRFHGHIFAIWLLCYAVLRSTVETFRGDVERGTLHGLLASRFPALADWVPASAWYNLSISQFISILMASLGAWLLASNLRRVARQPPVDLAALTAASPA